jgi:hypothetical protein
VEAATARFLSQVEEEERAAAIVIEPIPIRAEASGMASRTKRGEDAFFNSHDEAVSEPSVEEPVAASVLTEHDPVFVTAMNGRNGNGFHHSGHEAEFAAEHETARPKFAELAEEPAYTLLPKEYAAGGFGNGMHAASVVDERVAEPAALFPGTEEDEQRDLDVPAFMRRLQF